MIDIKAIEERLKGESDGCMDVEQYLLIYKDIPALLEAVKEARLLIISFYGASRTHGAVPNTMDKAEAWLAKIGGE
jgi:hypothetical protein